MANRNYSSVARATTLTSSVSGGATVLAVTETTGFPSVPFTMVVDPGRSQEEVVTVTAQVGLNLTVSRGQDGTSAQPHDAGASVRHMATARDFREAGDHIAQTGSVHGTTSQVVGVTDTQTLDNKTFSPVVGDHTALIVKQASGQATPLVAYKNSANTTLASVGVDGRITTPGVDGSNTSTFTAGAAGTVPLIAKGTTSQTAKVLSIRNTGNTEVASFSVTGDLVAATVTAPTVAGTNLTATNSVVSTGPVTASSVTASGGVQGATVTGTTSVTSPIFAGTNSSTFTAPASNVTPLIAKGAATSTSPLFATQNSSGTNVAGVLGDNGTNQLFHGGSATNKVPLKIHTGTIQAIIQGGTSSIVVTDDISAFGFTFPPNISATIYTAATDGDARRVAVHVSDRSTSSISFRVLNTNGTALGADQIYVVMWIAMQYSTSGANG